MPAIIARLVITIGRRRARAAFAIAVGVSSPATRRSRANVTSNRPSRPFWLAAAFGIGIEHISAAPRLNLGMIW